VAKIWIHVLDVNDNAPEFTQEVSWKFAIDSMMRSLGFDYKIFIDVGEILEVT
jgi:hypothetical protein